MSLQREYALRSHWVVPGPSAPMRFVHGLETELSHLGLRGKGAVTGSEPSDTGDQMSACRRQDFRLPIEQSDLSI